MTEAQTLINRVREPRTKRKFPWRIVLRLGGAIVLAILVAGTVAPFVNAARFSDPIRRALEAWLGRRVEFQAVHFTLFSGPGFSLKNVLIQEDPRYGAEPFAYVPSLDARIRWDKLLAGKIRFSSLRLEDPSLNFAKQTDGSWNVLDLVHRLAADNNSAMNLFPAFEVSDGRIDFRFGTRKTILYIAGCDLSVSPDRSGKLSVQFSGWPARTDRAGVGFGHVRGTIDWYPKPRRNGDRLESNLTLDPSNLSELATLFAGHDIGIHGTVSSHARVDGPLNALRIAGDLHIDDVHRWDLLASNGEDWSIRYSGNLDLTAHRIDITTSPEPGVQPPPVRLEMQADRLLGQTNWSVHAELNRVPLNRALPVARRLGMPLPPSFTASGTLNGSVGYSNASGLSGALVMQSVTASVGDEPRFQTDLASATITADHFHLDPATVQQAGGGTLEAGGDYYFSSGRVVASLDAEQFSAAALKSTLASWFGSPDALAAIAEGKLSGEVNYSKQDGEPPSWSGAFQMADATLRLPALAHPLTDCHGHFTFNDSNFSLTRFSGKIHGSVVDATYRYNAKARRPEQLRLEMPAASLEHIQNALEPALQPGSLLARLRFTRREIPAWLARRNLEADVAIAKLSAGGLNLGALRTHFVWQGPNVHFTSIQLNPAEGIITGSGSANLARDVPHYHFLLSATGLPWKKGFLNADAQLTTSGFDSDALANLQASGTFVAENVEFSPSDVFDNLEGAFAFSLNGGRPTLRAAKIAASDDGGTWTGEAETAQDGKLLLDLERPGVQRHIISTLQPETAAGPAQSGSEINAQ